VVNISSLSGGQQSRLVVYDISRIPTVTLIIGDKEYYTRVVYDNSSMQHVVLDFANAVTYDGRFVASTPITVAQTTERDNGASQGQGVQQTVTPSTSQQTVGGSVGSTQSSQTSLGHGAVLDDTSDKNNNTVIIIIAFSMCFFILLARGLKRLGGH
jgi:hypothetical protein